MRQNWLTAATVGVVVAAVACFFSNWMQFDKDVFGPKGAGFEAVQNIFGEKTGPAEVAMKLKVLFEVSLVATAGCVLSSLRADPDEDDD